MRNPAEPLATIEMHRNGYKVASFRPLRQRGFTVDTNGKLPSWHRLPVGEKVYAHSNCELWRELQGYLNAHGTDRQKALFGL